MPRSTGLSVRVSITIVLIILISAAFFTAALLMGMPWFLVPLAILLTFGGQIAYGGSALLTAVAAQRVTEAQAPNLHAMASRVAATMGVPTPRLAISKLMIPNAFAVGLRPKRATVVVTRGLFKAVEPDELEAILAHEIAHVVHRDLLVMSALTVVTTLSWMIIRHAHIFLRVRGLQLVALQLAVLPAALLAWGTSKLLVLSLSRYRELLADRTAALATGNPSKLGAALLKVEKGIEALPRKDLREVHGASALCIVSTGRGGLLSTHPPLQARLRQLDDLQRELEENRKRARRSRR